MVSSKPFKDHPQSLTKKFLPWTFYILLPLAILHLYFYPLNFPLSPSDQLPLHNPIIIETSSSPSSSSKEEERASVEITCDYTNGKWVHDKLGPLYNGTSCSTIKDGQNCMSHGRPDMGYLHWRWKPNQCQLPRFEPKTFLQMVRNKHLAFVGDSMARNQLESLLCMLATVSPPDLVYHDGGDNKFRRWHFPSHNVNVSIYWSPFLVKGFEKSGSRNYNELYLDSVDERWASDMDQMDMIVLSVGHWFLHPAVYFDGDSVMGCHFCPGQNYTEVGFYDVFRKAIKTTLKGIFERKGAISRASGREINIIVATFSPHHFEGQWDKFGACPRTRPYKKGEKELEGMDLDMRNIEVEEVEAVKGNSEQLEGLRLVALDITKLSLMRPDGHPGPYMYAFPFANGIAERVQNDCVHWCLPGPVDTWNEILLDVMKRWDSREAQSR
ncbi:hypothetical protein F0562_033669 [Nyssa sinensis]|uniref:Uncharacterized protein n=1 Tax=Nyssa sinensis TaxID=561372 RepID=A0A5J5AI25_9ASTE|nr:hypothetical protein F0562_033669 [Nyssa sinensis]